MIQYSTRKGRILSSNGRFQLGMSGALAAVCLLCGAAATMDAQAQVETAPYNAADVNQTIPELETASLVYEDAQGDTMPILIGTECGPDNLTLVAWEEDDFPAEGCRDIQVHRVPVEMDFN